MKSGGELVKEWFRCAEDPRAANPVSVKEWRLLKQGIVGEEPAIGVAKDGGGVAFKLVAPMNFGMENLLDEIQKLGCA